MTTIKQKLADELKRKLLKARALKTIVRDHVDKVLEYLEEEEREFVRRDLELKNDSIIRDFNANLLAEKDQQLLDKDILIAEKDQTLSQVKEELEVKLKCNALVITELKLELQKKEIQVQQLEWKSKQTVELHEKQLNDKNELIGKLNSIISVSSQQESERKEQTKETFEAAMKYQQELYVNKCKKLEEFQTLIDQQERSLVLLKSNMESAETQLLLNAKIIQTLEKKSRDSEIELLKSKQLTNETMIREIKQLELSDELKLILSSLKKDTASIADELYQKQFASAQCCSTNDSGVNATEEKDKIKNTSIHLCRLRTIYPQLIERFDAKKLAGWMFKLQAIGVPELQTILCCKTPCDAAQCLLDIILNEPSESIYKCFLTALKKTNQQHIASWIIYSDYDIESKHVQLIQRHHVYLVDNINSLHSSLIDELYARQVIDLRDTEQLRFEQTQTNSNEKLLSMLGCKSLQQFEEFLSALRASGHDFVVEELMGIKPSTSIPKHEDVDTIDVTESSSLQSGCQNTKVRRSPFRQKASLFRLSADTDVKPIQTNKQTNIRKKIARLYSGDRTSVPPEGPRTFGIPLEQCYMSTNHEGVPVVVDTCVKVIQEHGLTSQGIYRIPGNASVVNELQDKFDKVDVRRHAELSRT